LRVQNEWEIYLEGVYPRRVLTVLPLKRPSLFTLRQEEQLAFITGIILNRLVG
jgi:hypothetical protein